MEYKQFHQANQINRTGHALFIIRTWLIRLTQNYIPCLGQRGQKPYNLSCSTSPYRPYKGIHVHPPGLWLPVNAKCVNPCPSFCFNSLLGHTCCALLSNVFTAFPLHFSSWNIHFSFYKAPITAFVKFNADYLVELLIRYSFFYCRKLHVLFYSFYFFFFIYLIIYLLIYQLS